MLARLDPRGRDGARRVLDPARLRARCPRARSRLLKKGGLEGPPLPPYARRRPGEPGAPLVTVGDCRTVACGWLPPRLRRCSDGGSGVEQARAEVGFAKRGDVAPRHRTAAVDPS